MIQTRVEELKIDGENIIPKKIVIEVPMTFEMIQDCFGYYAIDAPTEIKKMLMEALGETIDKLILTERPSYVDEDWLKGKLNKVKITIF